MRNRQDKRFYLFGVFRIDVTERVLFGEDGAVPSPRSLRHPSPATVENSNHVLGKQELIERIWPDSFVEDNSLAQNVSILRKALEPKSPAARTTFKRYRSAVIVSWPICSRRGLGGGALQWSFANEREVESLLRGD